MSAFTFCRPARLLPLLALLTSAAGLLALSPAAHADPTPFDRKTSVVVTRLPLVGHAGRIPVQVQIGTDYVVGFDINIPAGSGSWTAPHDVPLTDLGIHCVRQTGTALHYVCGRSTPDYTSHYLKRGKFLVSLPVQRVGSFTGLMGTTAVYKADSYGEVFSQFSDDFPVVDGTAGPRSNAEVRNLTTSDLLGDTPARGDLAVTVTVVGGETKTTALDIVLPPEFDWTLLGTAGGGHLTCALTAPPPQPDAIHCTNTVNGVALPFPTGIFTAVLHLQAAPSTTSTVIQPSTVQLSYADGTSQVPDAYYYFINYNY